MGHSTFEAKAERSAIDVVLNMFSNKFCYLEALQLYCNAWTAVLTTDIVYTTANTVKVTISKSFRGKEFNVRFLTVDSP